MGSQLPLFEPTPAIEAVRSWAFMDEGGRYRYRLWRTWDVRRGRLAWVMLNPSTADAYMDDATVRTCRRLAESHGFGAIDVVNLYAYRTSRPEELIAAARCGIDIVGPDNERHLAEATQGAGAIVVAWGACRFAVARASDVLRQLLARGRVHCLGLTKDGAPRHPLYSRKDAPLITLTSPPQKGTGP